MFVSFGWLVRLKFSRVVLICGELVGVVIFLGVGGDLVFLGDWCLNSGLGDLFCI